MGIVAQNAGLSALGLKALEYGRTNLRVFPLQPGAKTPLLKGSWKEIATADADQIQKWWTQYPDANVAIATGEGSNIVVLDIDCKQNQNGAGSYQELTGKSINDFEGYLVKTPTGGFHAYYMWESDFKAFKNFTHKGVHGGLDARVDAGYVVAPPSVLCDPTSGSMGKYEVLVHQPPARMPEPVKAFFQMASSSHTGGQKKPAVSTQRVGYQAKPVRQPIGWRKVDLNAIEIAHPDRRRQVVHLHPATRKIITDGVPLGERSEALFNVMKTLVAEGANDDDILCVLTDPDYGISDKPLENRNTAAAFKWLALQLAHVHDVTHEHYTRCIYDVFKPVPGWTPRRTSIPALTCIDADEWSTARAAPDCVVEDYLFADVATLIAPGGTGKTTLQMYETAHIALGIPLYGLRVHKPGTVVILSAEDSRDMLVARLRNVCDELQLSAAQLETLRERVYIVDVSGETFRLTGIVSDTVCISEGVDVLIESLRPITPVLVVIDPAVSFGVGESRVNDAEQGLIQAGRRIRRALNCCVRYVHHSGKQNARDKAVDQYAGRGGSAFADGARMVHVLQTLDAQVWLMKTGTHLAREESGMVLARPKMSYCAPQGELYLRRVGYHFEVVAPVNQGGVDALEQDAAVIMTLVPTLDRPTQNTLQAMDTGLSRDRTRDVIRHLLDQGRLEYVESDTACGAKKYLRAVDQGESDVPFRPQ